MIIIIHDSQDKAYHTYIEVLEENFPMEGWEYIIVGAGNEYSTIRRMSEKLQESSYMIKQIHENLIISITYL